MAAKMGGVPKKTADTPENAIAIVTERVAQGADYIKVMVEDGTVFGYPGTPDVTDEVIAAACNEAHRYGKWLSHILCPL
ncbi:MAG: hypothetical protein WCD89_15215 [Anaerocolumna sp.]